jgi:transposase
MSTSLLYHAFSIRGYKYLSTRYEKGAIIFTIEQPVDRLSCSSCGSRRVIRRGKRTRRFRAVPIGKKPVFIEMAISRVWCRVCDLVRQVKIGFAHWRRQYTSGFERYALELSKFATIKDVAGHLGVSWDVIKDIQKRHLNRRFRLPKLKNLRQIAIDEISIGKDHQYLTIVMDLKSGAVVFVGDGKGADALDLFWKRIRMARAKIKAVAIDMSIAYISAIQENLPKAAIVFDHFHIIKLLNEKLTELRRRLYHELTEKLDKDLIKGTRWLLLKRPENLNQNRNEPDRLQKALEINQPLATAYYLKEDLRRLWMQSSKQEAEDFLYDWIYKAGTSKIPILNRFAQTLAAYRTGILAWYDYPISTGPLEGTNNKIKTMKRQAYGFRDLDFFKLKIMAIHETKYALVG